MGVPRDPADVTAGVDGQVLRGTGRLAAYANFVKVAHTVFALPFTIVGIVTASLRYPVRWPTVAWAVVAFGAARFTAMAVNRIVDVEFDRRNPRTARRELPSGTMRMVEAWMLVVVMTALFFVACMQLNPLCLKLSPLALAWVVGYSFTKRFTHLSHLWLGWGLAIAPVGGYLAVSGAWSTPWWALLLIAGGVACWVAGFDILYALQDEHFDREHRLKSIPVLLGARRSIAVARTLHVAAIIARACFGLAVGFGSLYAVALGVAAILLVWEHRLVREDDFSKLDAAFFTMNGIISAVVASGALLDVLL